MPCMVDGNKEDLHMRRAKIQRLKASLKLQDYNPKRDFVGWGGEDFRRISGMPGFTHYFGAWPRRSRGAGDFRRRFRRRRQARPLPGRRRQGRPAAKRRRIPQRSHAARRHRAPAAVWADYNGDGKPDLLLATPTGPSFTPTSARTSSATIAICCRRSLCYNLTAAAWIDYDGDGRPDLLLATASTVCGSIATSASIRSQPPADRQAAGAGHLEFEDVSAKVGLGPDGIGSTLKGDTLDRLRRQRRRPARHPLRRRHRHPAPHLKTPPAADLRRSEGFTASPSSTGKSARSSATSTTTAFPICSCRRRTACKLFKNDGKGHFTDVTAKTGDLASNLGWATSAAWGDFDNDGQLDLLVGCLKGPNRLFRNKGDGTFEDADQESAWIRRSSTRRRVALVDLNNDGMLDMVFNNEGQESCVLLGNPALRGKRTPLTLTVDGKSGIVGSKVGADKDGKTRGGRQHLRRRRPRRPATRPASPSTRRIPRQCPPLQRPAADQEHHPRQ